MAKLLTEEEYNALLADRERLEWAVEHCALWYSEYKFLIHDIGEIQDGSVVKANSMREAIDKARGKLAA